MAALGEPPSVLPTICIVGCERSGTTWVRSLFEAHPAAIVGLESHAYPTVDGVARTLRTGGWQQLLAIYDEDVAVERPAGLRHWVERDELAALVAEASSAGGSPDATADRIVRAVLVGYGERMRTEDSRVVVDKTPGHVFYTERILATVPEARIVEVLRDGRDVCVSMQHRATTRAWVPRTRQEQIGRWVDAVEAGRAAKGGPEARGRWHTIRYEDLKVHPQREARALLAFAGLPVDDEQLDGIVAHTDFGRYQVVGPGEHRRRGEVGDWRTHFDDGDRQLFERLAGATARAVGYG